MREKRNQEGRAKTARPTSRFLCPRPPLGSFTKEMGRPVVDDRCASRCAAKREKPSRRGKRPKGFQPIFLRSQLRRIGLGHPLQARPRNGLAMGAVASRARNLNSNRGLRSGSEGPSLHQAIQRGAPTRRISVSLGCLSPSHWIRLRHDASGCPRLRRDLSQIVFRLRQGGNALCLRLHFYVTQRDHFRLLN